MKKTLAVLIMISSLLGITSLALSPSAYAESPQELSCKGAGGKWEKRRGDTVAKCYNDSDKGPSVTSVIQNVVNLLLFLIGIIAVIVIVVSGFRFVTSNGDPQQVSKAKNAIIYAVIGIVVAVMAYAIVNFILDNV